MNDNSENERSTFVFYPTFADQIRKLKNKDVQLALFFAIADYGTEGREPDFSSIDSVGFMDAIFSPIKFDIDRAKEKYNKMKVANTENGKKGGAPKGSRNNPHGRAGKPRTNQELTETNQELTETKHNIDIDTDKDTDKDILFSPNVENNKSVVKKTTSVFSPPTLEEVLSFFSENGFTADGNTFFDYYESNGWLVSGKSKMKNWQAAARNWERRELNKKNDISLRKYLTPLEREKLEKEQRDAEFTRYFAEKLARGDESNEDFWAWDNSQPNAEYTPYSEINNQ